MKALGFLMLIFFAGCHTHSECGRDLYQSYFGSATYALLTLKSIDQGKIDKAHGMAMVTLDIGLSELYDLSGTADQEGLERQAFLAHSVLIYFTEHQAELVHDKYSLRTVTQLQKLLTEPADVQKAAEIAAYLSTSTTNQFSP